MLRLACLLFFLIALQACKNESSSRSQRLSDAQAVSCPAEKLCPKFIEAMTACEQDHKSKKCGDFISLYRQLAGRYDCQRSYDAVSVPAIWLCNEGIKSYPKPQEQSLLLLSVLKTVEAQDFFGSEVLRSTLDGSLAEEYESLSRKIEEDRKR